MGFLSSLLVYNYNVITVLIISLIMIIAYLIGAIPFGYIIVKITKKGDIRQMGSGNIGATNVIRVSGFLPGLLVFILDGLKGSLVVLFLPSFVHATYYPTILYKNGGFINETNLSVLCGLCVFLGHLWSVYLGFRGGKGVAVGFGVFIVLAFYPAMLALGIWCIIVFLFRYVSLGSVLACCSLPISVMFLDNQVLGQHLGIWLITWVITALLIVKHRPNIKRMLQGTEPQFGK